MTARENNEGNGSETGACAYINDQIVPAHSNISQTFNISSKIWQPIKVEDELQCFETSVNVDYMNDVLTSLAGEFTKRISDEVQNYTSYVRQVIAKDYVAGYTSDASTSNEGNYSMEEGASTLETNESQLLLQLHVLSNKITQVLIKKLNN
ncbi:UNVERIFIED_CONTAM: hypothetical protein RMT77_011189 [Armadillidium vulgare]